MKTPTLILIVALLALVSCGPSYEEKQQTTKAQRQQLLREDSLALKIATVPTLDCLPIFIAYEDSLFQSEGVVVHLRQRNAQLDCDTLIAGGWVEGFVSDLIRTERLRKHGTPLTYVAATNAYWQVIANRMARITKASQLSDKMIAITRYSATDYLADLCIKEAKPKYDVFRIQVNDVHVRLNMLLNNEMDAMLLTEPQATTARLYKNPVLMDSRKKDLHFGVIAFSTKALDDKRRQQQLKAFVKVYNAVCDSINQRGLAHYGAVIEKYTGADAKTIKALPKLVYQHAAQPRAHDVEVARRRWQ
jgi:NitT/TauT family transport system substrate-binding protein